MKYNIRTKIRISIGLFFVLVILFTILYKTVPEYTWQEALYTSLSFQTFAGTNLTESKAKNIAILQMTITYILIGTVLFQVFEL
jgi:hypothetical protein